MSHVDRRYPVALTALAVVTAAVVLAQAEALAAVLTGGPPWWLAAAAVGRALVVWAGRVFAQRAATAVKAGLRKRVLRGACGTGEPAGSVVTLVVRGLDAVEPYFAGYLPQLAVAAVVPVAVVARLSFADLSSALVVLATLPLVPVFAALVGLHTRDRTREQWAGLAVVGGHFLDVVRGLGTLRLFGRAAAQARTVREMAGAHASATLRALRVAFLSALVLELVATLSVALVAVPVGLRLLHGGVTLHVALLVLLLAPEAYLPLRAAGAQFHASAEGLAVLAAAHRPVVSVGGTRAPDLRTAEVVVDRVVVRHPGRDPLPEVSLRIAPGERVALVGPSGAGKSTLLRVLLGFVVPASGRVLVGGVDLRGVDRESWLAQVAWVPQRPTPFPGTVADTIALGGPGDVLGAARAVGLGHLVGASHALSSGERQRVALARALVRVDARMLLLDEPTSRLDGGTEEAVLRAVARLSAGRTALVVAHRPALLGGVDRVVALP
ncbi:thiol reductant ABC exporter subunit CydD [Saccharothrix syringae]|uniref:Thiol reductant ABC exporter subunit CydD n=1 Tax=Saccharothrix syringae TaxID=103733 RepID=A0A5Q0GSA2_SACSY|nr:thiol reductant ABC exporter subunit CydD [Saccharothrix syringae]QFZ16761.1 thiol reductant ABC exporter subunit CydD [Saccharothrix syringae]